MNLQQSTRASCLSALVLTQLGAIPGELQIVLLRKVYKLKFDLQPGSLTDQVAGEHQPSKKHP